MRPRPSADLRTQVASLLQVGVVAASPQGRAGTGERWQLRLADGREVFVKARAGAPDGFFAVEAAGLRWLAAAGGPPVPEVHGCGPELLVLSWLPPDPVPTAAAVEHFGRELAALHAAGAPAFGADRDGWVGAAPLDNAPAASWAGFYASRRVEPYVRRLRDQGRLSTAEAAVFDRLASRLPALAGPAEPPARLHGDLWSGNVLWSGGRGWLVDPAAHGGHRETDLAMLDLFGAPELPRLLAAYEEVTPLAAGWRQRRALHQVHPLLVHALLFPSGGYLAAAVAAAGRYC